MTRRTREPSTALFIALVAITLVGPMSIHLFLPAIALVQRAFTTNAATAQLSFSLAMFAMAFGTLVYGSLSDKFGRLPVLLGGLGLFTAGAAIAAVAEAKRLSRWVWLLATSLSIRLTSAAAGSPSTRSRYATNRSG